MKFIKNNWIIIGLIVLIAFFVWYDNKNVNAQVVTRPDILGQLLDFDFGLLNAPTATGIPANNLRCIKTARWTYQCYDLRTPRTVVPFSTAPTR